MDKPFIVVLWIVLYFSSGSRVIFTIILLKFITKFFNVTHWQILNPFRVVGYFCQIVRIPEIIIKRLTPIRICLYITSCLFFEISFTCKSFQLRYQIFSRVYNRKCALVNSSTLLEKDRSRNQIFIHDLGKESCKISHIPQHHRTLLFPPRDNFPHANYLIRSWVTGIRYSIPATPLKSPI